FTNLNTKFHLRFTVQSCLQDHIPTGPNPENETCDTTESSDLKLCPTKVSLEEKSRKKREQQEKRGKR
ncbi:MAG: hypothetical protein QG610_491, partial [Euryarchaeota archaeon]|nr:hypothetical protein [Euryarchaeota archaeon]